MAHAGHIDELGTLPVSNLGVATFNEISSPTFNDKVLSCKGWKPNGSIVLEQIPQAVQTATGPFCLMFSCQTFSQVGLIFDLAGFIILFWALHVDKGRQAADEIIATVDTAVIAYIAVRKVAEGAEKYLPEFREPSTSAMKAHRQIRNKHHDLIGKALRHSWWIPVISGHRKVLRLQVVGFPETE